jgi:hypothetical protein
MKPHKAVSSLSFQGDASATSLDRACRNHRPDVSVTFTTFAFDDSSLPWLGINT